MPVDLPHAAAASQSPAIPGTEQVAEVGCSPKLRRARAAVAVAGLWLAAAAACAEPVARASDRLSDPFWAGQRVHLQTLDLQTLDLQTLDLQTLDLQSEGFGFLAAPAWPLQLEPLGLSDSVRPAQFSWGNPGQLSSFARFAFAPADQDIEGASDADAGAPASPDAGHVSLPGTLVLVVLGLALLWGTPLTASLQRWLRRTFASNEGGWRAVSRF